MCLRTSLLGTSQQKGRDMMSFVLSFVLVKECRLTRISQYVCIYNSTVYDASFF